MGTEGRASGSTRRSLASRAVRTWRARPRSRTRERAARPDARHCSPQIHNLAKSGAGSLMTRIHGDFHLGQVLVGERRRLHHRFRRRAGDLDCGAPRQNQPAARCRRTAALDRLCRRHADGSQGRRAPCRSTRARRDRFIVAIPQAASQAFLHGLLGGEVRCATRRRARALLDLFLIEKAAYEIAYEAANRPTWIGVPLAGLSRLLSRILGKEPVASHG